jgi:UDP-GlcNAc:undecaprenyl-phosphate GlcNAc-1-phosphate transferase
MIFLSTLLLSVFITIALIPLCSRVAVRMQALDMPDPRKVHTVPVPRCGGVAMALGALGPIIFWAQMSPQLSAYLAGCAILFFAGMYDDFRGLGYQAKFMAQVVAALVLVLYGGVMISDVGNLLPRGIILPGWLVSIVTVVVVVGVTNAINLADGLDGLAGGISLLICLIISFLAYLVGNMNVAIIALSLSGSLFGFLRFNTYPASLFMGDTGSMLLGYSVAMLSITLTQGSTPLSPLLPLILLGFPILDTLVVMAARIAEGRSPFSADKNHFHHRLMGLGFFQTEAVFIIYVIQVVLIVFAFVFQSSSEWFLLLSYALFSLLVVGLFTVADRTGWKLRRFDIIDRVIKGRLRQLRGKWLGIRISFGVLYFGLPALLVFLALLPDTIPTYLTIASAFFAAVLTLVWLFRKEWLSTVFMPCLYMFIPLLVYAGELGAVGWVSPRVVKLHYLVYVVFAFFSVTTLKFTRRKGGFRITPMDFIVVILALAVMMLPREILPEEALKRVFPAMLAMFFGYEVLVGELRGEMRMLAGVTILSLIIVSIRGIV